MKYLLIGSNGFIGRHVKKVLDNKGVDVFLADKLASPDTMQIDLFDKNLIKSILDKVKPDIIINCAGIVENSERAIMSNPVFALNLLQSISDVKLNLFHLIVMGSAAEYGIINNDYPISEDCTLNAESYYARSKLFETAVINMYRGMYGIPTTVLRVFNPIGPGMHDRFLIPNIIKQAHEFLSGQRRIIEINRLDSKRDYIDVRDVASAISVVGRGGIKDSLVYNVGSGTSITNKELVDAIIELILDNPSDVKIKELIKVPENNYASLADISKIKKDYNWSPSKNINGILKEIVDGYKNK